MMNMSDISYADDYRDIDFGLRPEKYHIGKGEQGVLIAEPSKSGILQHWRFKTPDVAKRSASKIYSMFLEYLNQDDFVVADMTRKFLQMGFTRARRYTNHADSKKYAADGSVNSQATDWVTSLKAESARIFYGQYVRAKDDECYAVLRNRHKARQAS